MIYINQEVTDGLYWLNLQLPHFELDAAPSRPVLYPLTDVSVEGTETNDPEHKI
jgi:hypothetical protein